MDAQPGILKEFARQDLPRAEKGSVFVGAGDSYAAALAGFYASRGRCAALDPYVLASNPEFADGVDVYFISVSGRTSSNALAASRVRSRAKRITALTAVTDSKLALLSDRVVRLPMDHRPRMPGIVSFSLSLLAVLKITGTNEPANFAGALQNARKDRLGFSEGEGTTYFLGSSLAHPAALYAAAKVHEILGTRAHAELMEEFSHMELFSLDRSDLVNVFGCFDPFGHGGKLVEALAKAGYESRLLSGQDGQPTSQLFHVVFATQLSVLETAKEMGLGAPRFLSLSEALNASDAMIY